MDFLELCEFKDSLEKNGGCRCGIGKVICLYCEAIDRIDEIIDMIRSKKGDLTDREIYELYDQTEDDSSEIDFYEY